MKTVRVMFVMPVSCIAEVEVEDDLTDIDQLVDEAYQVLPGFTDQNWDGSDSSAFDEHSGKPYMVEVDGVEIGDTYDSKEG